MKIIKETDYAQAQKEWTHLFDICQPKPEMLEKKMDWFVRDGFNNAGTLMVGDLMVLKQESKAIETHPFPEWVVQMHQPGKKSGKVYAIIPMINDKEIRKLETRDLDKRAKKVQELIEPMTEKDFLAIEYSEGISIKIPANVPHDFIGVTGEGESTPYCQVFEPNIAPITEIFKVSPTAYFTLKFVLKI